MKAIVKATKDLVLFLKTSANFAIESLKSTGTKSDL